MFAIFKRKENNLEIVVSKKVKSVFDKYKQITEDSTEGCGILIGRHSLDGKIIRIEMATSPSKSDERRRFCFKINSRYHQDKLNRKFIESQNESVYLGTWHTHPEPEPIPSRCDIKDWKKQYKVNKHIFENMVFIIVGQKTIKYWLMNNGKYSEINLGSIFYGQKI